MEERAFAKINLALHVRAREPDGYHRIETLFAFAEDGDRLHVAPGEALTLAIEGPFGAELNKESDNLVLRAAEALRSRCGIAKGAALTLDKRLPLASGIGGGSADAAAALRLLARWWQCGDEHLAAIAASLGADVPACLDSVTVRGERRGDRLVPLAGHGLEGTPLLLVNPGVQVSTAAAYAGWDGNDRGGLAPASALAAAAAGRNDLEASALALAPEIGGVLDLLRRAEGVVLTRMSGSGATCFALFETLAARDAAAALVTAAHPGWWQLASRVR
jgi:4-diphosphocytidyl-2-C-methyl-D-erythritol kinase